MLGLGRKWPKWWRQVLVFQQHDFSLPLSYLQNLWPREYWEDRLCNLSTNCRIFEMLSSKDTFSLPFVVLYSRIYIFEQLLLVFKVIMNKLVSCADDTGFKAFPLFQLIPIELLWQVSLKGTSQSATKTFIFCRKTLWRPKMPTTIIR